MKAAQRVVQVSEEIEPIIYVPDVQNNDSSVASGLDIWHDAWNLTENRSGTHEAGARAETY
jgi:hypothetical protein